MKNEYFQIPGFRSKLYSPTSIGAVEVEHAANYYYYYYYYGKQTIIIYIPEHKVFLLPLNNFYI